MAVFSRLQSFIFGGAVARGASDAVTPVLEPVRQHAWQRNQLRVLDPNTAARLVTQAAIDHDEAVKEAARNGYGPNRLNAMIYLAYGVPAIAEALALRRRGELSLEQLHHVYAKEQIEPQYWARLDVLLDELLTPGELAAAIHRGLIPDPGLLQGEQPTPPFNVESYPVYDVDAVQEARGHGFDRKRLGVLVGLQGLPMGVIEAAQAYFRKIITHGDYIRAFNESNNRNEWARAVLEYARQIPTARDFMENALRGHHDFDWAAEQAARHGMERDDAFIIYQNQGRPLNLHQITQALAWGAKYNPGQGDNPDPWMQSVLLGAVRPEYYEMQDALKYNLPSAFFFRVLQQSGVLSEAEAVTWYKRLGWPSALAEKVAAAFAGDSETKADPLVTKARNQLWATMHRSFVAQEADATALMPAWDTLGVPEQTRTAIYELWDQERALVRKQLTPAQIKRAYTKSATNEATGQPWTRDEALAALVALGYAPQAAGDYLNL